MNAEYSVVHAAASVIETVAPGIRRQMLGYGPDLMVCRVEFDAGAVGAVHRHVHSQVSYVESGRFRVLIDGQAAELGKGDSFYVGPQVDHGSECLEAGVLIDTFSPHRADFLAQETPA